eukprot:GHVT01013779.1.p1 GENE.GHVT01013779.1~~GHVT01013779.1.p1  ORF type:complete len:579 (-),score=117.04 GHVT01013779.1:918-2654(-)
MKLPLFSLCIFACWCTYTSQFAVGAPYAPVSSYQHSSHGQKTYVTAAREEGRKKSAQAPRPTKETVSIENLHVTTPPRAPPPSKEPVCIEPSLLGIPTIYTCEDLVKHGKMTGTLIVVDEYLRDNVCTVFDDLTCDSGSGEGLATYRHRIVKKGGRAVADNRGVGDCLDIRKQPNGVLRVGALVRSAEILCCRARCEAPEAPADTEKILAEPEEAPEPEPFDFPMDEKILAEPEEAPVEPFALPPQPMPQPMPMPLAIPTPPPVERAEPIAVITTTTTRAPMALYNFAQQSVALSAEYCVMPQYLSLPRVSTCADLRDLALSTDIVTLTNIRTADCQFVEDPLCGPTYPGLGAFLDAGKPEGACLAMKQGVCSTTLLGPYPILGRHIKDACRSHKGHAKQQMVPFTMMLPAAAPGKKSTGRRLNAGDPSSLDDDLPLGAPQSNGPRNLQHSKGAPSKGPSDTVILCCRLECGMSYGSAGTASATYASYASAAESQRVANFQAAQPVAPPPTQPQPQPFNGASTALCEARYAPVCALAAPLRGEKIIFDQRCLNSPPPPGCFAGGISPCCRSVDMGGII